jgi:cob(I)alamin adenosyltransferase
MSKGLIIANTGNGKGKTTAAFGLILRAIGHEKKSAVVQFIKSSESAEIKALKKLAPTLVELFTTGLGFTWKSEDIKKDEMAAQKGWEIAKDLISNCKNDLIVLDEITYPINLKMISEDEVCEVLSSRREDLHIVVTGRDLPSKLATICDTITEMGEIKHHFKSNVKSQPIIEF